jgi:hypothetical protein
MALLLSRPLAPEVANEALLEAEAAASGAPDAEYAQATLCSAAVVQQDQQLLEACSARLRQIAPAAAETHLYGALVLALHDQYDQAEAELDAARAAGIAESLVGDVRQQIDNARPRVPLWQRIAMGTATGVGTLFVLFVVGMLLSDGSKKNKRTRRLYVGLLTVAALCYYVFAIVIGVTLLLGMAFVVYAFLLITDLPRPVQIGAGVVALYVLFAIVRASFTRVSREEKPLDLAKEKALKQALDAVTTEMRERKVDEVYIRPDATIAVVERGGALGHLRKKSRRQLYIGVFALDGLSRRSFEALVACEVARFRGGGGTAVAQREAFEALADRMRARGVATAANPAWWIVASYKILFDRIAEGAIAWQDVYADEQAAALYGGRALLAGFKHQVQREIDLEARAADLVREAIEAPEARPRSFDEAWLEHAERAGRIESLDEVGLVDPIEGDAWALFASREELERDMHERLEGIVSEELGLRQAVPSP